MKRAVAIGVLAAVALSAAAFAFVARKQPTPAARVSKRDVTRTVVAHLSFPSEQGQFDNFAFRVNGQPAARAEDLSKGATARLEIAPGGELAIELTYDSRGLDTWTYALGPGNIAQVQDFTLTRRTDFDRVDFPPGTMSPTARQRRGDGWELTWRFESLLTRAPSFPAHPQALSKPFLLEVLVVSQEGSSDLTFSMICSTRECTRSLGMTMMISTMFKFGREIHEGESRDSRCIC